MINRRASKRFALNLVLDLRWDACTKSFGKFGLQKVCSVQISSVDRQNNTFNQNLGEVTCCLEVYLFKSISA